MHIHSPLPTPAFPRSERNMCQHSDQLYLSYQFLAGINMLISRGWRHGILECRRENMRSHNSVSCDNKRQSRKAQTSVSRNKCVFKSGQMGVQSPLRRLWDSVGTQRCWEAGYTAMAVLKAGSHPVNISEQKNITAERTLDCFPRLSLRDSILLFWRQGFRRHTASFSTFSTAVTSLPKFRGKKKLNPVKVSPSLRHIPGAGINSGACHVWDIVEVRWKLRKMDGTIKVRVENGVYEFLGDCFGEMRLLFFEAAGRNAPLCRSVSGDLQRVWPRWAAFPPGSKCGIQISFLFLLVLKLATFLFFL